MCQRRNRGGTDGKTGQECHLRVTNWNKTVSSTTLFFKHFLSMIIEPARASFSFFEVHISLKTINPALAAYISTFSAISTLGHP